MCRNSCEGGGIQAEPVIPAGALDAPPGVVHLAEHHAPGQAAAGERIVRRPVLGPAQQHTAGALAADPGQEAAPGGAEGQGDVPVCAGSHQGGGGPGVGEGDDAGQGVEGVAGHCLLAPVGYHVLPVQGEVDVLAGDKERVQKMSHDGSSMACFR